MNCIERCPHCVLTQMVAFTNGWGGCFLTCLDCGYSDPVTRKPDPYPTPEPQYYQSGRKNLRRSRAKVPSTPSLSLSAIRRMAGQKGGLAKARNAENGQKGGLVTAAKKRKRTKAA